MNKAITVDASWVIRDLCAPDLDDLRGLYRAAWTSTYLPTLGPAALTVLITGMEASDLTHLLPGPKRYAAVATVGQKPVGTACINVSGEGGRLSAMYIDPRYQRRGVGTALLRYLAGKISGDGCLEAMVLESSTTALSFYSKLGFREIGQRSEEAVKGHLARFRIISISMVDLRGSIG
jgi:ribosomal protein S18 acetylase RimI-like enzyme